jgi:(S)-mandelate dehydrogenase
MPKPVNVLDYRELARTRLARIAFDYLECGAEDEVAMRRNREALAEIEFDPRVLAGVGAADLRRTFMGRQYPLPLVVGPAGFLSLYWPEGETTMARATARAGIPFVAATLATTALEEIAHVDGLENWGLERWFQLYAFEDEAQTDELIARAQDAGYTALVLTADSAVSGKREATMRNGSLPIPKTPAFVWDVLTHPGWAFGAVRYGAPRLRNFDPRNEPRKWGLAPPFSFDAVMKRSLSWQDAARFRKQWKGAFVVKGIQSVEDARKAANAGVDGIVLSNHGGRQLDSSPSPMEILPEVADAVGGGKMAVMADSGIRRGSDILKALALGADAVWLGRAPIYGLAAAGEKGVSAVLEILRQEMESTMALIGVDRLSQLDRNTLRPRARGQLR